MESLVEAIAPTRGGDHRSDPEAARHVIHEVLGVIRAHLGMEVAFVSRVGEGKRWLEYVDASPDVAGVVPVAGDPLEASYCARVLDGRIPGLVVDASREPGVADLMATWAVPVGSHLSVPIVTARGETYGTLCCFSRRVLADLHQRDLDVLRMFADVVRAPLETLLRCRRETERTRTLVSQVLDEGGPAMALQPIVALADDRVRGFEALARFPGRGWTPDVWFAEAARVGMGNALEAAAVHGALRLLPRLPEDCSLSVNVSASALVASASIPAMFASDQGGRLVLEVTEHDRIGEPERLTRALRGVREAGVRIAVDDAGSGYAGLERILHLRPEVLKLDQALVQGVATHPGRQAMCEAMVRFTERTGAHLVAEGVETDDDLAALKALGVGFAQGYLLGRPTVWA